MTNEEIEIIKIVFQSYLNIVQIFKKPNYISEEVVTEVRDKLIKTLEQQPCEDCTVIKKLSKKCYVEDAYGYTDEDIVNKVNEIIDVVNELSSVTPKTSWIPCSERLPKENEYIGNVCKYYLIQDEYGDMHVARLSNVGWIPMGSLKAIGDEIIAWQELPQSYKAESEDNECKGCYYNDEEVHAECVICDKAGSEGEE